MLRCPMTDTNPIEQPRDPAYGWVMVFVVFLLSALAFGALGSISVFLKPLVAEFGWSRGQTSFGIRSSPSRQPCLAFCGDT